MVWKRFTQSRSAGMLFNKAADNWRRRQQYLLQGDDDNAQKACAEVVRLCQLTIQSDQKEGDAYVLLANALLSATSRFSKHTHPDQHKFLYLNGAAVIQLWHSLPHRGYPITKNQEIGDNLWRITVDEIKAYEGLSENEALDLMESYKNRLAHKSISPSCIDEITKVICFKPELSTFEPDMEYEQLSMWYFNNAEWHALVATAYMNQGRIDEAILECQEALRIDSSSVEAHRILAETFELSRRNDEAISEYKKVLEINPNDRESILGLEGCYDYQQRGNELIRKFEEQIGENPNDAKAHIELAFIYSEYFARIDDAIEELKVAITIDPNNADVYLRLGGMYEWQNKFDEAIVQHKQALEIDSAKSGVHHCLGRVYSSLGRSDEAIAEFKEEARVSPGSLHCRSSLEKEYLKRCMFNEAIATCLDHLNVDDQSADSYNRLGLAYYSQGELDKAIHAFKNALSINSDLAEAHSSIAIAYNEQGYLNEAEEHCWRAIQIYPSDAGSYYCLAIVYDKANELDNAFLQYRSFIKLASSDYAFLVAEAQGRIHELQEHN